MRAEDSVREAALAICCGGCWKRWTILDSEDADNRFERLPATACSEVHDLQRTRRKAAAHRPALRLFSDSPWSCALAMACPVVCKPSDLVGGSEPVCHWEIGAAEASHSTARHAGPIGRHLGLVGYSARQISREKGK